MEKTPILAIMYDFDHTLSPRDMQEYGFIPDLGMEADVFWNKCLKAMKRNQMDQILAYMYMMLEEAKGKLIVNRNMLRALGKDVQLFDGVSDWFARVNEYARSRGLQPEHYIIFPASRRSSRARRLRGNSRRFTPHRSAMTSTASPAGPRWRSTTPVKRSSSFASTRACWM